MTMMTVEMVFCKCIVIRYTHVHVDAIFLTILARSKVRTYVVPVVPGALIV